MIENRRRPFLYVAHIVQLQMKQKNGLMCIHDERYHGLLLQIVKTKKEEE